MGYRIIYDSDPLKHSQRRKGFSPGMTVAFFALFLLTVNFFWPEGKHILQKLLWPGDWQVLEKALDVFVEQLRWGEPFADAATAFCREFLHFEHVY